MLPTLSTIAILAAYALQASCLTQNGTPYSTVTAIASTFGFYANTTTRAVSITSSTTITSSTNSTSLISTSSSTTSSSSSESASISTVRDTTSTYLTTVHPSASTIPIPTITSLMTAAESPLNTATAANSVSTPTSTTSASLVGAANRVSGLPDCMRWCVLVLGLAAVI
ncbi:hypothetical protein EJ03DRAFT_323381 [Teratosphaeria nubilosa]|uniref:REJ domain-containing protein n=1 Tax=Teratosphaeria nubilosa TaxID=161662 RepID=A0A6G1LM44_9PEZI|nr:hypothetical protein EJ03DRAFT_323381 [Teratosphaeria nubilosa]